MTPDVAAVSAGHESFATTKQSYATGDAVSDADQTKVLDVLLEKAASESGTNGAPTFRRAAVAKKFRESVELNGIEPSAS